MRRRAFTARRARGARPRAGETLEKEGQPEEKDPPQEIRRDGAERVEPVRVADLHPGAAGDGDGDTARHVTEDERVQWQRKPFAPGQGLNGEGPSDERNRGGGPHADAETDESRDTRPHAFRVRR